MTKEQLDEIVMLAEARLVTGGSADARILAQVVFALVKEAREAHAEIERLNRHLNPKPEQE